MRKDFEQILVGCIDETLRGLLGRSVREIIYLELLTIFSVTKEELPTHLADLLSLFEVGFGPRATKLISRTIAKCLYLHLHIDFVDHADFDLERYVNEAKSMKSSES